MTTPATAQRRWALVSRTVVAVTLSAAIIAVTTLGPDQHRATADAITDKIGVAKHALAADGARMAQLRAQLAASANTEADLKKTIADLDNQITLIRAQVADAQRQVEDVTYRLAVAETTLADTQFRLAFDRRQLTRELVVLYQAQNDSNDFSNFLSSGDFNSFWQHVLDVSRLNAYEQQLVTTVTSDEQTVLVLVARVTLEKQQKTQLLGTRKAIERQLNDALSTKQQAVARERALQAGDQQLLAQAVQSARELKAQIDALNAQERAALAAGGGNGHFAWPETGPITQGFGCTDYPYEPPPPPGVYCASGHFHSGIDIAAPCGNDIAAADSGIAHTYYSSYGFGDHVIIVHGNGWVSVYGHMWSNFAVSDGQTVHRGQLIGHEGSTGNSSGCHLHFEVDLNGVARNPLAYLS